jgi:hypothetical protein
MSPSSAASVSSTAGVDATLASNASRTDSVATTTPLTSTSVPEPNASSSNDGEVAAPASPTTKKKQKRNRGSGKNKNKNKAVPAPAATPAVDPVSNIDTSKIGRDPAWDARIMAILHECLAEYLNNRLPGKNTNALNGEVNARIADRLGPMCGFNLANLMAKIPGPVLGTTIRNNVLPMEHIPLCKVAPKDYDWEVNARNKFRKDCRRVRRHLHMQ